MIGKWGAVLALGLWLSFAGLAGADPGNFETDILTDTFHYDASDLDVPISEFIQACSGRDCIPAIDNPRYVPIADVDFMRRDDLLLTVVYNGAVRAYPLHFLDRHEIVNTLFGDEPVAVTYCPLCGSGLAFLSRLDGVVLEFGVSGLLRNSDLVMYDRNSQSLWQQISGKAIGGPLRGQSLHTISAGVARWQQWKEAHPQGQVLAPVFPVQQYRRGLYQDYQESNELMFPVSRESAQLKAKKLVFGISPIDSPPVAFESDWLRKQGQWSTRLSGQELAIRMHKDGSVSASLGEQTLVVHRMYWFAWYNFHPDTALIDRRNH